MGCFVEEADRGQWALLPECLDEISLTRVPSPSVRQIKEASQESAPLDRCRFRGSDRGPAENRSALCFRHETDIGVVLIIVRY
jgi:hypothetical protein